jgi:hypothetical protein
MVADHQGGQYQGGVARIFCLAVALAATAYNCTQRFTIT